MHVEDIRTFVPCENFEISQAFYKEIGFRATPASEDLVLCENGDCFFFLQRFYHEALAHNFMLQICVSDIDDTFALCSRSVHKTKISEIQHERWGQVFYLWGPSGELLHITQLAA